MLEEKKLSKCMYGRDNIHVNNHYHHLTFASLPEKRRWRYSSPSLSSSPSLYGLVGLADRLNNLTYSATKKQKLRELWSEWVNLTLNGIIGVSSVRGLELLGRVGVLVPSTYSVHSGPANTMSVVERALVTLGSMSVGIGSSSGGSSGGGSSSGSSGSSGKNNSSSDSSGSDGNGLDAYIVEVNNNPAMPSPTKHSMSEQYRQHLVDLAAAIIGLGLSHCSTT